VRRGARGFQSTKSTKIAFVVRAGTNRQCNACERDPRAKALPQAAPFECRTDRRDSRVEFHNAFRRKRTAPENRKPVGLSTPKGLVDLITGLGNDVRVMRRSFSMYFFPVIPRGWWSPQCKCSLLPPRARQIGFKTNCRRPLTFRFIVPGPHNCCSSSMKRMIVLFGPAANLFCEAGFFRRPLKLSTRPRYFRHDSPASSTGQTHIKRELPCPIFSKLSANRSPPRTNPLCQASQRSRLYLPLLPTLRVRRSVPGCGFFWFAGETNLDRANEILFFVHARNNRNRALAISCFPPW